LKYVLNVIVRKAVCFACAAVTALVFASAAFAQAADLPEGTILNLDKNLLYNILIQLFNVSILIVVLIFLLFKPVSNFLANRKQGIQDEIADARRIREEAGQLKEKYEKMIEAIEEEREEILRETRKKAVEKSDQLLFEARREVEVIHDRAKTELEAERENLSDEMKRQIVEIAHMMAGRFVQLSIDGATQDRLIEQALDEWDSSGGV